MCNERPFARHIGRVDSPATSGAVKARTMVGAMVCAWVLAGCGIAVPIEIGPRNLDVSSAQAPRCGPQPYPFTALQNGEQGNVVVAVQVDPAGVAGRVSVAKGTLSPLLNQAALDAARHCRFAVTTSTSAREVRVTVVYAIVGMEDKNLRGAVLIGLEPGEAQPEAPAR